jgi:hypothetical protein
MNLYEESEKVGVGGGYYFNPQPVIGKSEEKTSTYNKTVETNEPEPVAAGQEREENASGAGHEYSSSAPQDTVPESSSIQGALLYKDFPSTVWGTITILALFLFSLALFVLRKTKRQSKPPEKGEGRIIIKKEVHMPSKTPVCRHYSRAEKELERIGYTAQEISEIISEASKD